MGEVIDSEQAGTRPERLREGAEDHVGHTGERERPIARRRRLDRAHKGAGSGGHRHRPEQAGMAGMLRQARIARLSLRRRKWSGIGQLVGPRIVGSLSLKSISSLSPLTDTTPRIVRANVPWAYRRPRPRTGKRHPAKRRSFAYTGSRSNQAA